MNVFESWNIYLCVLSFCLSRERVSLESQNIPDHIWFCRLCTICVVYVLYIYICTYRKRSSPFWFHLSHICIPHIYTSIWPGIQNFITKSYNHFEQLPAAAHIVLAFSTPNPEQIGKKIVKYGGAKNNYRHQHHHQARHGTDKSYTILE